MTQIAYRNVDVPAGTPVSELPFEAILAMIERQGLAAWRVLAM